MQHEITEMLIQGKGTIVNCSSVAGLVGFEGLPAYAAQAWHRINKNSCIRICRTGNPSECRLSRSYTNPMMDRLRKEAIEGTAFRTSWTHSRNSQCCLWMSQTAPHRCGFVAR
jgi:hypothetical protein